MKSADANTEHEIRDCYEIVAKVGDGSFGTVYRARHRDTGATYALKLLKPLALGGHGNRSAFQRELALLLALHHEAIVKGIRAFEVPSSLHGSECWLVMEWLEGCDLRQWLDNHGVLSLERATEVFLACARALAYIQREHRITHRDIKPSNVFLCSDGRTKLLDLGLGRARDTGTSSSCDQAGTLEYMAPEFFCAQPGSESAFHGSEQSDIFSLGVTFYESLTGHRPFRDLGATDTERLANYALWAHGEKTFAPDCSWPVLQNTPALAGFFRKCLARSHADRYRTFDEAIADTETFHQSRSAHPAAPPPAPQVRLGRYTLAGRISEAGPYLGMYSVVPDPGNATPSVCLSVLSSDIQDPEEILHFQRENHVLKALTSSCAAIIGTAGDGEECTDALGQRRHYYAVPLVQGPSLQHLLSAHPRGLPLDEAVKRLSCVAAALEAAHAIGVFHPGLTPAHILCPGPADARLGGYARRSRSAPAGQLSWTASPAALNYLSPEYTSSGYEPNVKSEVFSFGVLLYETLTGSLPFAPIPRDCTNMFALLRKLDERHASLAASRIPDTHPAFANCPALLELVTRCLVVSPEDRLETMGRVRRWLNDVAEALEAHHFRNLTVLKATATELLAARPPATEATHRLCQLVSATARERAEKLRYVATAHETALADAICLPQDIILSLKDGSPWCVLPLPATTTGTADDTTAAQGSTAAPARVVRLLRQCLQVLHALHAAGVAHGGIRADSLDLNSAGALFHCPPLDLVPGPDRNVFADDLAALATVFIERYGAESGSCSVMDAYRAVVPPAPGTWFAPPLLGGKTPLTMVPETGRVLLLMLHASCSTATALAMAEKLEKKLEHPYLGRTIGANRLLATPADTSRSAAYNLNAVGNDHWYEVLEDLPDRGGFGVVSRLHRLSDGKLLAAKRPTREPGRFSREIDIISKLRHPNIVEFVDTFEEPQYALNSEIQRWLVMELLDGKSLRHHIAARRHAPEADPVAVLALFAGYAAALAHCHEHHIIHRDIKPSNMFVTAEGVPKLLDFGISRCADETRSRSGLIIPGTYDYMAPETGVPSAYGLDFVSFRGNEQSDVFSLGMCLFEALTGGSPFGSYLPQVSKHKPETVFVEFAKRCARLHDDTHEQWFVRHLSAERQQQTWLDRLPLQEFMAKALHRLPAGRFANAREMERDLRRLIVALTTPAPAADEIPDVPTVLETAPPPVPAAHTPAVAAGCENQVAPQTRLPAPLGPSLPVDAKEGPLGLVEAAVGGAAPPAEPAASSPPVPALRAVKAPDIVLLPGDATPSPRGESAASQPVGTLPAAADRRTTQAPRWLRLAAWGAAGTAIALAAVSALYWLYAYQVPKTARAAVEHAATARELRQRLAGFHNRYSPWREAGWKDEQPRVHAAADSLLRAFLQQAQDSRDLESLSDIWELLALLEQPPAGIPPPSAADTATWQNHRRNASAVLERLSRAADGENDQWWEKLWELLGRLHAGTADVSGPAQNTLQGWERRLTRDMTGSELLSTRQITGFLDKGSRYLAAVAAAEPAVLPPALKADLERRLRAAIATLVGRCDYGLTTARHRIDVLGQEPYTDFRTWLERLTVAIKVIAEPRGRAWPAEWHSYAALLPASTESGSLYARAVAREYQELVATDGPLQGCARTASNRAVAALSAPVADAVPALNFIRLRDTLARLCPDAAEFNSQLLALQKPVTQTAEATLRTQASLNLERLANHEFDQATPLEGFAPLRQVLLSASPPGTAPPEYDDYVRLHSQLATCRQAWSEARSAVVAWNHDACLTRLAEFAQLLPQSRWVPAWQELAALQRTAAAAQDLPSLRRAMQALAEKGLNLPPCVEVPATLWTALMQANEQIINCDLGLMTEDVLRASLRELQLGHLAYVTVATAGAGTPSPATR